MSADLPDIWSSPSAMARALATYIADPAVVRRAVLDSFSSAPQLHTIKRYREEHLAPPPLEAPFKPHEGYYPADVSRGAEAASKEFLRRLKYEREQSAMRALNSTFLTEPRLVAARFDREVEKAWRRNGELAA